MEAPIPTPKQDDDEDVHWALSTAGALWARGEHAESLKWLRRAAEQASDVNADMRALELFKAAADVATKVNTPAPAAAPVPAPAAVAAPVVPATPPPPPPVPTPRPPAPSLPRPTGGPPGPPPAAAARPSAPPPPPPRKPPTPDGAPPRPTLPPPRPGSLYPAPPAPPVSAAPATPRPPSVQAPAPRPPQPSVPSINKPVESARPAAAPKPPVTVTAPRAVAITTAKPEVPPAAATPKRRRSFTGEARPAEKARPAEPARTHRRRRTFEDEATVRHAPAAPRVAASAGGPAAGPPAHVPDPGAGFDDLDEDTRVLQHRPDGGTDDVIHQAFDRLHTNGKSGTPATPSPPDEPARAEVAPRPISLPVEAPEPDDTLPPATLSRANNGGSPGAAAAFAPRPPAARAAETPPDVSPTLQQEEASDEPNSGPPSQETKVWTQLPDMDRAEPQTQRPGSIADTGPVRPAPAPAPAPTPADTSGAKLDTLPALRVAVLATGLPGEVRLIALGAKDDAPPGAALAVLVPLSATDGEAVARLFAGHD